MAYARIKVGSWLVEPELNRVSRGGHEVAVEPRVLDVLLYLASRAGQVCSKDEIIRNVWTETFVTDEALWHCISQLRKIFGDDARSPNHIETVYKRGYRLVAPVETLGEGPSAVSAPQFVSEIWGRALLAIGVMLAVAGLVYLEPFRTESQAADRLTTTPLTSFSGQEIDPAISPDGRQLAFSWNPDDGDNYDIYLQLIGENNPFRLTSHEALDHRPTWSPDGSFIAFVRHSENRAESGVFVTSVLGGDERRLAGSELGHMFNLTWSPDGEWLALASTMETPYQYRISLLSPKTGELKALTAPPAGSIGDRDPSFSADGRYLAFRRTLLKTSDDLYWTRIDGSSGGRLTYDHAEILGIAWYEDSVLFSSDRVMPRSLWRAKFPSGQLDWVPMGDEYAVDPAISTRTGRLVYQRMTCDANIWELNLSDAGELALAPLISSTRVERSPEYSPDGARIAFVSNRSGRSEVWLADASGSRPRRITSFNGPTVNRPRWAPDNRHLVFDVVAGGQSDLYLLDVEVGAPLRLTDSSDNEVSPSWSADGGWIYFGSDRSGDWQLWRMAAEDRTPEQVTTEGGVVGLEDPGGQFIYVVKRGEAGIWKYSRLDRTEERIIQDVLPHDSLNWTVTKAGIFFVKGSSKFNNRQLAFYDFGTGSTAILMDALGLTMYHGLSVSPSGKALLMVRTDNFSSDIMLAENFK